MNTMNKSARILAPDLSLADAMRLAEGLRADQRNFQRLAARLRGLTGIHLPLSDKNLSLMASRIAPLLRALALDNYDEYLAYLDRGEPGATADFVTALTTNTTEFFRESRHFDTLAAITPELIEHTLGRGALRFWCAACSTGQEPYSIVMALRECAPNLSSTKVKFLATDIDHEVLAKACRGAYTEAEVQSVPPLYRQKYFRSEGDARTKRWLVKGEVKESLTFAPFNLMTERYPFQHQFDVIFCRNVLIYFDRPVVNEVLSKLTACLRPGGYLFLGHSESGTLRSDAMPPVATAVFRKRGPS